jgi:hypothetical protein
MCTLSVRWPQEGTDRARYVWHRIVKCVAMAKVEAVELMSVSKEWK